MLPVAVFNHMTGNATMSLIFFSLPINFCFFLIRVTGVGPKPRVKNAPWAAGQSVRGHTHTHHWHAHTWGNSASLINLSLIPLITCCHRQTIGAWCTELFQLQTITRPDCSISQQAKYSWNFPWTTVWHKIVFQSETFSSSKIQPPIAVITGATNGCQHE